jgi:hypothetical protein
MRGWLIESVGIGALILALGTGHASAQYAGAPGTGILTLPPLGTPGTGIGSGTGGAGNSRLGGSVGGVPGMGQVMGPTSSGIMMPGGGVRDYQGATGAGRSGFLDPGR